MDRRLTPVNDRVALDSLRGIVAADTYTAGEPACVAVPLADLCAAPEGARDRQLLLGEAVTVVEQRAGWSFVQAAKDGYCGYVRGTALAPPRRATHWLSAPASHLYPEPRVQAHELAALSFMARVTVTGESGQFSETCDGFIPSAHLAPLDAVLQDPAAVATMFLGTPYLWGGNSRAGIDCSGLVQAALIACGIPCPGDSDLQAQSVGSALPGDAPLQPGDLLFWQGHAAIVADGTRLIHATGHVMSVVYEDTAAAIARIAAKGQPVIARRRPL